MSFNVDEKVVYPSHGVALVEDIVEKLVSGSTIEFYKLNFLFKDMTVLVPINNLESTGVRPLTDESEMTRILDGLNQFAASNQRIEIDMTPSGWNMRSKNYQFRLESGTFKDVMSIYQELMILAQQKDLSFGEKNLLHTSEELLAQEMMIVQDIDRSVALQMLRSNFKQFVVSYAPQSSPPHNTSYL